MTQHPDGTPGPGLPEPRGPRSSGGGPPRHPGGGPPYRPGPPVTDRLRPLLTLTLVSFGAGVLNSVVETVAGPGALPGAEGLGPAGALGTRLAVVGLVMGVLLTAGLYALVYFPLREGQQWGWVLGVVFCSLAVLGDAFGLVLQLLGGQWLPGLTTLALVAVNVAWLVVAGRPGVRAALR